MRLNAPLFDIPCDHPRLKPDQFICQKFAKNLIIYRPFMIAGVWFVGKREVIRFLLVSPSSVKLKPLTMPFDFAILPTG